ncbi:unnamed protein product, partial [Porites lobata]
MLYPQERWKQSKMLSCSFASVANKLSTSVAVTYVGSKELEATADLLGLKKFFSVEPVIPGIAKFHSLEPLRNGLIRCRTFSYQSTWIEMGVQFSGSENEDLHQNDSDDQDSSSLSKGSNSTSSVDEDETSEEKGDFFGNASRNSHHTYKEVSSESSKEDSKKSEHWTLLPVLPKEKSVVVLDSMPSNHIKHTSLDAISKMCGLLKEINSNVDLNQCKLIVNKKGDVPEQTNDHDC